MNNVAFSNPCAPFWPLGLIRVPKAGIPVAITANVGTSGLGPMNMPRRIRQLIIIAAPGNTKPVYLVLPGYSHLSTNGVILVVPPDQQRELPIGCLLEGAAANVDQYYIDSVVDGEGAYATAIWG